MKIVYTFLLVLCSIGCFAQKNTQQDWDLERINLHYKKTNTIGMSVLTGWASANILTSGVLMFTETGPAKHFHQMNVGWGAINLALGGVGLWRAVNKTSIDTPFAESYKRFQNTQKMFLVNGGIDVGYIFTGLFLWELSRRGSKHADILSGFGQSFVMQGSFLLAFDFIMFFIHQRAGKPHHKILSGLTLSSNGIGLRLTF
ncbi:MAG: hypothetical protein GY810_13485 [Aureispira sp.]|nr:hypothetical protein [Aureispira sp.]